jgi:hypothetical protein
MSQDLVALTRLGVRFSPDRRSYNQSTSTLAEPGERHRTRKIQWQRECEHLGGGTFGQVYLERCMEAGRTEEKRAVKKIIKISSIDYKRELEVLAALSYKKRVGLQFRDGLMTLIDKSRSAEVTSSTTWAGMRRPITFTLSWTSMNSAHSTNTWLQSTPLFPSLRSRPYWSRC